MRTNYPGLGPTAKSGQAQICPLSLSSSHWVSYCATQKCDGEISRVYMPGNLLGMQNLRPTSDCGIGICILTRLSGNSHIHA